MEMSSRANASGHVFESVVNGLMASKRIDYIPQATLDALSIFGKRIRVDVLVEPCVRIPDGLIIEVKWQGSLGSAEEKLPFLVINIKQCYPYPTIVVIDGDGFSSGSIEWIRDQVDGSKLLAVFSSKEFITWCNREL
jgi:hypothetical protein